MTFGERLKQLREERGMDRKDLALELGRLSYITVASYENDITTPSLRVIGKICRLFDITPEELFKGVELL